MRDPAVPVERWGRLFDEHWRRQTALRSEERARRVIPWLLVASATLIVIALSVGSALFAAQRAARDDSSRCSSPSGAAIVRVEQGGWAEPDLCQYYDADGIPLGDSMFAGIVTRSIWDGARLARADIVISGVVMLGWLVTAGGGAVWRSRRRRRRSLAT